MANIGRNTPCPCGSGKKYKQCCLPKEQAGRARTVTVRRDDELLMAKLVAFGQRPAFFLDQEAAFDRFWNGGFGLEAARAMRQGDAGPFLEWYIYDYRTGKEKERLVDLFAAEEGPRLGPEQRALLAKRQAAYLSLYGIEAVEPAGYLQMGDLLAGGFFRVEDPGLARLAVVGDLLLGRRLGDGEASRMSWGSVLLPGALGQGLSAAAKRAYSAYREEHYQATWPEFLREAGYVMYHYLDAPEAAEAYGRAARHEGYYDPRPTLEAMRAIVQKRAEERAREQAEEEARQIREEEAPFAPPVERTSGGILVPGQVKPTEGSERRILLPGDLRK